MSHWGLSILTACLLAFCLPGFARSSNGAHNNSSQSKDQQMQGCIVRQGSYYFLQPEQGQPMRLQWSSPVSKNQGHVVQVEGHQSHPNQQQTVSNNGSTPQKSVTQGPSGDQAATSKAANEGDFVVDKLQVISTTCPAGTNGEQH